MGALDPPPPPPLCSSQHVSTFLLGGACCDGVVRACSGPRCARSHAASRHAFENTLELRRAVREAVAPEAVARVLDELDKGYQKPPLRDEVVYFSREFCIARRVSANTRRA